MPATGNEATHLSQLKTWWDSVYSTITAAIAAKLTAPTTPGTNGQVLSTDGENAVWIDAPEGGTAYTGTAPVNVSGTTISVAEAGAGTLGVVQFASDDDFKTYMEIE